MQYTEIMALFWVLITLIFCSFAMQPSLLANLTRQIHIQITSVARVLLRVLLRDLRVEYCFLGSSRVVLE